MASPSPATLQPESPLPTGLKLAWASGAFGVAVLMNGISALVLFYLTVVLRIEPAVAGFLIFVSKIYDAITDPLSGYLSDRTQSRHGRRRPYLFWGALLSGASFLMVFTIPWSGPFETVTAGTGLWACAYILLALLLYTSGYSMFNVPYMAMPAEMTRGFHERSSLHGYRVAFAAAGGFAVQLMAGVILETYGKDWDAHARLGAVGAGLITVTMLVAFFGTARAPSGGEVVAAPTPIRTQVRSFLGNRPFQLIMGVKLAQLIGVSASTGGLIFLLTRVLNEPLTLLPWIGAATTVAVFVSAPALIALSRRIGKRGAYAISAIVTGATALSWAWVQPGDPAWTLVARGFLLGIAFAGNVTFAMSMLADAMEADRLRTGLRREGMYSATYSFVEKLAASVGPLVIGGALSAVGFDPTRPPTVVDEGVRQAVLLGLAYVPAAMAVLAVTILWFYRLDESDLQTLRTAAPPR
jgi:GPH family glycoside/pentoside/hexuronide:cation symporter